MVNHNVIYTPRKIMLLQLISFNLFDNNTSLKIY